MREPRQHHDVFRAFAYNEHVHGLLLSDSLFALSAVCCLPLAHGGQALLAVLTAGLVSDSRSQRVNESEG